MKSTTKLTIVLCISISFFITEIAIGFKTKSIALIADASAWLQLSHVQCPSTPSFSYAYHRADLVGAFFNVVFLLALALSIFLQSIERFINISPVDQPLLVLIVGGIGLALNLCSALVVHDIGVMIAGAIILKLHSPSRYYADPAVSLAISLMIFASAVPLTLRTARILLEAAPKDIDVKVVRDDLLAVTS
ncbi:hypothetical protein RQP46_010333 [Phenoliferia psychrophenolica]